MAHSTEYSRHSVDSTRVAKNGGATRPASRGLSEITRGYSAAALPRPRTSLANDKARTGMGGDDALSRVASFMVAGRASLAPDALAMLSSNRSQSASLPARGLEAGRLQGHQAAWGLNDAAKSRKIAAPHGSRRRLPEVRPKSSIDTLLREDSISLSRVDLPLRSKSVMGVQASTHMRSGMWGNSALQDNLKDLEGYTAYMEQCTAALEDRLQMHVPLQDALAANRVRYDSSVGDNLQRDEFASLGRDLLQKDPTTSVGDFDESQFDQQLAEYLRDVRRAAELPRYVTRVQRWWRMISQRRKFRRFKVATRIFRNRAHHQLIKGWQFVALAENWMRGTIQANHLQAWRMLARNSSIWNEESALIFVQCMRAGTVLQQALFLECNDKRTFRRAALEYNWGRGWKFGRPLPTREHVMVVQVLRHKIMWSAKQRIRRWRKYLMWRKHQRGRATEKLRSANDQRFNQKFVIMVVMWYRWSVLMRVERNLRTLPDFEPHFPAWDNWYKKRLIGKAQDSQNTLDETSVKSLKWRFLCRAMWVAWLAFLQQLNADRLTDAKIKKFTLRKYLENALADWRDFFNMGRAINHRNVRILHAIHDHVKLRHRHRRAGAQVAKKWHTRCLSHILFNLRKLTSFMLVINAGGINRIRKNFAKAKWAVYGLIAYNCPLDGPERKPGGLLSLGVCDGHFHLTDCWMRWSSRAKRRQRMKRLVFSVFYEDYIYKVLLPALIAWKRSSKRQGQYSKCQPPTGEAKVTAYQRWVRKMKFSTVENYLDPWLIFPRMVVMMKKMTEDQKKKAEDVQQFERLSIKERIHKRKTDLEIECGVGGKNFESHFPKLRDFVFKEKRRQDIRCVNNLKYLKRDYKLLLMGELNDITVQYTGIYNTQYAYLQGTKPVRFKSDEPLEIYKRDEEQVIETEQAWFPESTARHDVRISSAKTTSSAKLAPFYRPSSEESKDLDEEFGELGLLGTIGSKRDDLMSDEALLAPVPSMFSEVAELNSSTEEDPSSEGDDPTKDVPSPRSPEDSRPTSSNSKVSKTSKASKASGKGKLSRRGSEKEKGIGSEVVDADTKVDPDKAAGMWDYEEKGKEKNPQQALRDQMAATLKTALDQVYNKMIADAANDAPLSRRMRETVTEDPYFDVAYPERQKAIREQYAQTREQGLGPNNTARLLELESLNVSVSQVTFAEATENVYHFGFVDLPDENSTEDDSKSHQIEDHIISASFGRSHTFYGIDVAMDLAVSGKKASQDVVHSPGRPRRKSKSCDDLYSEAVRLYRARCASSSERAASSSERAFKYEEGLITVLESELPRTMNAAVAHKPSLTRPPSSRRSDADSNKVFTRIPTVPLVSTGPGLGGPLSDSIKGSTAYQVDPGNKSSDNTSPKANFPSRTSSINMLPDNESTLSPGNKGLKSKSAFTPVARSSADRVSSTVVNSDGGGKGFEGKECASPRPSTAMSVRIVVEDMSRASSATRGTSASSRASQSTIEQEQDPVWDEVVAENGWIQQEAHDIAEALRGDMDSLYWRSHVIHNRSRRQRAVQMAIDKDFAFSKAIHEAQQQKMNEELYVNEVNKLASLNDSGRLSRMKKELGKKSGKLERGFTIRRDQQSNGSLSESSEFNLSRQSTADKSMVMYSDAQVLALPDSDDREFLQISQTTGRSRTPTLKFIPKVSLDRTGPGLVSTIYELQEKPDEKDLNPARSLTDLMLTSKRIPTSSSPAKQVPRFNEVPKPPSRIHSKPQTVLVSAPIEEQEYEKEEEESLPGNFTRSGDVSSGFDRNSLPNAYMSLEFPRSVSEHVAGGARIARNLQAGSSTARKHIGVGKLSVALERPHTERNIRQTASMIVTGGNLKPQSSTRDSSSGLSVEARHAILGASRGPASGSQEMQHLVDHFGLLPSRDSQANLLVGGARVGTIQSRGSSASRLSSKTGAYPDIFPVDKSNIVPVDKSPTSDDQSDHFESAKEESESEQNAQECSEHNEQIDNGPEQPITPEGELAILSEPQRSIQSAPQLETLWQPWGYMGVRDILSELYKDTAKVQKGGNGQWDTMDPKTILQHYGAYGADGKIDLSKQLRPPTPEYRQHHTLERIPSNASSVASAKSSRPPSANVLSPFTSANQSPILPDSRPVSVPVNEGYVLEGENFMDMDPDSRPSTATEPITPDSRPGTATVPITPGSNTEEMEGDLQMSHLSGFETAEMEGVQAVRKSSLSDVPEGAHVSERSYRNKLKSTASVAASKAKSSLNIRTTWSGVVKEAVSNTAITASGPYLTVKSFNKPLAGSVATAALSHQRSTKIEEKAAILGRPKNLALLEAAAQQRNVPSTIPLFMSAKKQIPPRPWTASTETSVPDASTVRVQDILGPLQGLSHEVQDAADSIDATIDELRNPHDACDLPDAAHASKKEADVEKKDASEEAVAEDVIAQGQVHAEPCAPILEAHFEHESTFPLSHEPSEQELRRIQELLEVPDVAPDEKQVSEFQKYVTELGDDKIDQFKVGRKIRVKGDTGLHNTLLSPKEINISRGHSPLSTERNIPQVSPKGEEASPQLSPTEKSISPQFSPKGKEVSPQLSRGKDGFPLMSPKEAGSELFVPKKEVLKSMSSEVYMKESQVDEGVAVDDRLLDDSPFSPSSATLLPTSQQEGGVAINGVPSEVLLKADDESLVKTDNAGSASNNSEEFTPPPSEEFTNSLRDSRPASGKEADNRPVSGKEASQSPIEPKRKKDTVRKDSVKISKKKAQYEIDLFQKYRDDKYTKKLSETVPEWKKIAKYVAVPSVRRVVLSSSSESSDGSDDEKVGPLQRSPAHRDLFADTARQEKSQSDEDVNAGETEEKEETNHSESIVMDIARKQYDALYGSENWHAGESWKRKDQERRAAAAVVASLEEQEDGRKINDNPQHWTKDRRLKQAHTADRFYEAIRLRQGAQQAAARDEDRDDTESRYRNVYGNTTVLPVGKFDVSLAKIRSQQERAMQVLDFRTEEDFDNSIDSLPLQPAPRPGALVHEDTEGPVENDCE